MGSKTKANIESILPGNECVDRGHCRKMKTAAQVVKFGNQKAEQRAAHKDTGNILTFQAGSNFGGQDQSWSLGWCFLNKERTGQRTRGSGSSHRRIQQRPALRTQQVRLTPALSQSKVNNFLVLRGYFLLGVWEVLGIHFTSFLHWPSDCGRAWVNQELSFSPALTPFLQAERAAPSGERDAKAT